MRCKQSALSRQLRAVSVLLAEEGKSSHRDLDARVNEVKRMLNAFIRRLT